MKIQNICIGDGKIEEYRLDNMTLTMIFEDYAGASCEIVMHRCSHLLVRGSVGFSLSEAKFARNEAGDHWCFHDEDGAAMEIRFNGYAIRQIQRAALRT
jgi:hypothetical protein